MLVILFLMSLNKNNVEHFVSRGRGRVCGGNKKCDWPYKCQYKNEQCEIDYNGNQFDCTGNRTCM
jgi:hypothetical protein